MALTGFQQFVVDRFPPEQWPDDIFTAYLFDKVHPDEWRGWIERRVLEAVRGDPERWPTATLLEAATGKPIVLPVTGSTKAQQQRRQRALRRIEQNEEVQHELVRLRGMQPSSEPTGEPDASPVDWQTQVWTEAFSFAKSHPVSKVSANDVASYLFTMATHRPSEAEMLLSEHLRAAGLPVEPPGSWAVRDTQPQLWANLAMVPVPLLLPPGSIVVDVTRSSLTDVEATWKAIEDTQIRLGHPKDKGGRPEQEAIYLRVAQLRRTEIWTTVAKIISDAFPPAGGGERDPHTLRQQYRNWEKRTGRRPN